MADEATSYYHLAGTLLQPGSIIEPGNFGRIIRKAGWAHTLTMREMALEAARVAHFPHRPSRMDAAFAFVTLKEAEDFRRLVNGFAFHSVYRVALCKPEASLHIVESRLCGPAGLIRHDWAIAYWQDEAKQPHAIAGLDWGQFTQNTPLREVVTLSPLRVEERLS